jgi:hypothetical protein
MWLLSKVIYICIYITFIKPFDSCKSNKYRNKDVKKLINFKKMKQNNLSDLNHKVEF